MAADSFEKTNFGWQVRLLLQQAREWVELQMSQRQPQTPDTPPSRAIDWESLSWLGKVFFWIMLALLLAWVGLQVFRLWGGVLDRFPALLKNQAQQGNRGQEPQVSAAAWVARSRQYQRQGKYRAACRALYMAMLQRLHDIGAAPNEPSRTDGEYRQIVEQLPHPAPYQTLLATHERHSFGSIRATLEDCDRCQEAYRAIGQSGSRD